MGKISFFFLRFFLGFPRKGGVSLFFSFLLYSILLGVIDTLYFDISSPPFSVPILFSCFRAVFLSFLLGFRSLQLAYITQHRIGSGGKEKGGKKRKKNQDW